MPKRHNSTPFTDTHLPGEAAHLSAPSAGGAHSPSDPVEQLVHDWAASSPTSPCEPVTVASLNRLALTRRTLSFRAGSLAAACVLLLAAWLTNPYDSQPPVVLSHSGQEENLGSLAEEGSSDSSNQRAQEISLVIDRAIAEIEQLRWQCQTVQPALPMSSNTRLEAQPGGATTIQATTKPNANDAELQQSRARQIALNRALDDWLAMNP